MEIKVINRWLIFALVVNGLLMLSAIISLTAFRVRVRDYKPPFPLSNDQILETIGKTTYGFLTNYSSRVEEQLKAESTNHFPVVKQADFSVYGFRRNRILYNSAEYGENDFIDMDGDVLNILAIDFERQRFYAVDCNARAYVCIAAAAADLAAPARPNRTAERQPGNRASEDGTL